MHGTALTLTALYCTTHTHTQCWAASNAEKTPEQQSAQLRNTQKYTKRNTPRSNARVAEAFSPKLQDKGAKVCRATAAWSGRLCASLCHTNPSWLPVTRLVTPTEALLTGQVHLEPTGHADEWCAPNPLQIRASYLKSCQCPKNCAVPVRQSHVLHNPKGLLRASCFLLLQAQTQK